MAKEFKDKKLRIVALNANKNDKGWINKLKETQASYPAYTTYNNPIALKWEIKDVVPHIVLIKDGKVIFSESDYIPEGTLSDKIIIEFYRKLLEQHFSF